MILVLGFLIIRYMFGGSVGLGPPPPPAMTYAAYTKGFQDGKMGAEFDPIADAPTIIEPAESSSGSSWGIGKMMSLAMAGLCRRGIGGVEGSEGCARAQWGAG